MVYLTEDYIHRLKELIFEGITILILQIFIIIWKTLPYNFQLQSPQNVVLNSGRFPT